MQKPQRDFPWGPKLRAIFPLLFTPQLQMPPPLITSNPQRKAWKRDDREAHHEPQLLFAIIQPWMLWPFHALWKTHPDQMLAGVARSGGVVHFKVSACCLWSLYWSRAAWCSLLFGDKATDSTPSLSHWPRQTYKHKHPISNPLVGCWRQTGLYLYPFKPSSGSAIPISHVGTSVFLFGGNQT